MKFPFKRVFPQRPYVPLCVIFFFNLNNSSWEANNIQECHSVVKIPSLTTTQSGSAWVMWKLDDDQSLP